MTLFKNVNSELYTITDKEKDDANNEAMLPANGKKGVNKLLAGIALTLLLAAGGCSSADKNPNTTTSTSSANPGEKQPSIPGEAKSFVAEYGSRYHDTATAISTYYAEKSYESEHGGKSLLMSKKSISEYDFSGQVNFPTSPLGFSVVELPLDAPINQETTMKLFNEYTAPMLSLYMNLIAKNPSPDAVEIIDVQFKNYCAGKVRNGYSTWDKEQAKDADTLLTTAKSIVAKHGPNANYTVLPASTDEKNPEVTLFNKFNKTHVGYNDKYSDTEKLAAFADGGVILGVSVSTYEGSKMSVETEKVKSVQLSFERQPMLSTASKMTYLSIGQD